MERIEIIKSPEEVNGRICELGEEISQYYGTTPLTLLVVMNGGLFFGAKLAESIKVEDFYIDSITAGSYKHNISSGVVQLRSAFKLDPKGRNILIVDEVLDTGRTLKKIQDTLFDMGSLSVKTAVLVEKELARPDGIEHADWAGFFMDDRYSIGCGMDSEERYRNYPGIGVLVSD
jgi:hypoxanthine phosphoribosyltransferase